MSNTFLIFFAVISHQKDVLSSGAHHIPVVLAFDEMALQKTLQYSHAEQKVYGPHASVQVGMVHGLFTKFTQPVYYEFDQPMTSSVLLLIICALEDKGLCVEAMVSDMGSTNTALWKVLGIKPGATSFEHKDRIIQVFADVPHLIKLLRNHYLDKGFFLGDGTMFAKSDLKRILKVDNSELRIAHKLKEIHFECKGPERQRVLYACQLFSHSTACAYRFLFNSAEDGKKADFVELVNNAFDILNSRHRDGHKKWDFALGWQKNINNSQVEIVKGFVEQREILLQFKEAISSMRVILEDKGAQQKKCSSLLPFQKGWLISIDSALELFRKLQMKYDAKFLLLSRCNQDCVENLFSRIRFIGGPNTHPGPVDFSNRLRLIVLGQSTKYVVDTAVVKCDSEAEEEPTIMLSQLMVSGLTETKLVHSSTVTEIEIELDGSTDGEERSMIETLVEVEEDKTYEMSLQCSEEGLKYIAGYLAKKLKFNHPELSGDGILHPAASSKWIDNLSFGGLTKPSKEFFLLIKKFEEVFEKMHGQDILHETKIIDKLHQKLRTLFPLVSDDIIRLYSRTRTHIRIKHLKDKVRHDTLRNKKKIKHFCT